MKKVRLVYIFIVIYLAIFLTLSIMKHNSFNSTGADLGEYDQQVWGLSKGELIYDTTVGFRTFSAHFNPILILIAPFYWIYSNPITLLVLQTIALSFGALGVYLIAKLKLKNENASLILSAAYLLNPSVHYINLFDFHPIAFAIPFILFAFYFMEKRQYTKSIIFLVLLAMTKEHLPVYMATFGAYMFLLHKKRKMGAILAVIGVLWFIFGIFISPYLFSGGTHGFFYFQKYLTPIWEKIAFLILLTAPVGFLALFSPQILLLGIVEFGIILIQKRTYTEIIYQHQGSVISLVFIAAIYSISLILKNQDIIKKKIRLLKKINLKLALPFIVLISTSLCYIAYGPFTVLYDLEEFNTNTQYVKTGNKFVEMIPKEASVSTNNWVIPHISQRYEIYKFPKPLYEIYYGLEYSQPDYVLLDMSEAIIDPKRSGRALKDEHFNLIFNDKNYGITKVEGTWVLLKKGENYEKNICEITPFLNKQKYPYLNLEIENTKKCR